MVNESHGKKRLNRRKFMALTSTGALAAAAEVASSQPANQAGTQRTLQLVDDFSRPDSAYHGDSWETLTPGHWRILRNALRCTTGLTPLGDDSSRTAATITSYTDPPYGMLWNRAWHLQSEYRIEADFTIRNLGTGDGHELGGVCFGGKSLYEGWHGGGWDGPPKQAAWYVAWRGGGKFGVYDHAYDEPKVAGREQNLNELAGAVLKPGDRFTVAVTVAKGNAADRATLTVEISGAAKGKVTLHDIPRTKTEGFFGIVRRGNLDFQVDEIRIAPGQNRPKVINISNLVVAIPMGKTLRRVADEWHVKVLCLFRSEGNDAAIRVVDRQPPEAEWEKVPISGQARIVTNRFRHHTAVVDVTLPADPSEKELQFTVWKDGQNVTTDPRVESYVGRLPRLSSPYKMCGLACHAISAGHFGEPDKFFPWRNEPWGWNRYFDTKQYHKAEPFEEGWIFEQPRPEAYQHIEDFKFQILSWDDDIWYLELPIFPPTVDDVYRIIGLTVGGRIQRRMMMRHWNVLLPGDHDFGADDFKGTEQYAMRTVAGLPQDGAYLRNTFAAVWHVITADEKEHTTDNPTRYTCWQMPKGDLSLIVTDARLFRTPQTTFIWESKGWGKIPAWKRTDPNRTLLGEEQFAWLDKVIRTEPAPLIVVTGLNGMNMIWFAKDDATNRAYADLAGFNQAATSRILRLLGSRDGIISTCGDLHVGCIARNLDDGVIECIFGPTGYYGASRQPKPGFGPRMQDWDSRNIEVIALYHQSYESPDLKPQTEPRYWNFLELTLETEPEPRITSIIRNIVDSPQDTPRGGGHLNVLGRELGRSPTSWVPDFKSTPYAAVRVLRPDGMALRAARADSEGWVRRLSLTEVDPGEPVLVVVHREKEASANIVLTKSSPGPA